MYRVLGKRKTDTEWKSIDWGGVPYYSPDVNILHQMIGQMLQAFPYMEYKIEEWKLNE